MPRLTLRVRTKDNLLEVLSCEESAAWVVSIEREDTITHVEVVNWEGTQMVKGIFDRKGSKRLDDRLVLKFLDGHVVNCVPKVEFDGQNPVRYLETD